jgi:hypothetical protein
MNEIEDAQARLAEITKRRDQAIDAASRGRHRGWDAAGAIAMVAGFAAMDLPVPWGGQLAIFFVATIAALTCFTRAGQRGKAVMHRSQVTGRFWAVLGGVAAVSGVLAFAGLWLVERIDMPLRHGLLGLLLAAFIMAGQPLYRRLMRRAAV